MATIRQQVEAMKIYKDIYKIRKDAIEELKKSDFFDKIKKSFEQLFSNQQLDLETARILRIFFDNNDKLHEGLDATSDSLIQALNNTIKVLEIAVKDSDNDLVTVKLADDGTITCNLNNNTYLMEKDGLNYKILKLLGRDYIETNKIKHITESKSAESIRKAIGKINNNIKRNLKLEHFIESKPGDGYRINNLYNLVKILELPHR